MFDETEGPGQDEREDIHWSKIKDAATLGEYRGAWSDRQWREEMQASTEIARQR